MFKDMTKEAFYAECALLIGAEHVYVDQGRRAGSPTPGTRWGGREPGNGRFPGHGIIRVFSPTCIHVNIKDPDISRVFTSYFDALFALWREKTE